MNWTFASSGSSAICSTELATFATSITASARIDPSACGTPRVIGSAISVSAFPMSICPQAMS